MFRKKGFKSLSLMRLALLAIVFGLVMGCKLVAFKKIPPDGLILAFGDSLTEGFGVAIEDSYPSVLQQLAERQVINAGITGETTAQGLARFESVLQQHEPDLVILTEGGNDILQNIPNEEIKSNLLAMIQLAHDQEVAVLLIGVPAKSLFSNVAPFYPEIAKETGVVLVEKLVVSLMRKKQYKLDWVHFNELGYQKFAEGILDVLQQEGAL